MKPIIDPMYIYLVENLDHLRFLLFLFIILSIGYTVYLFVVSAMYKDKLVNGILDNEVNNLEELNKNFNESALLLRNKNFTETKSIIEEINIKFKKILSIIHEELYDASKNYVKKGYRSLSISILLIVIYHFIPSTELGYKLIVTSYITEDKVNTSCNLNKECINLTIKNIIEEIKNLK